MQKIKTKLPRFWNIILLINSWVKNNNKNHVSIFNLCQFLVVMKKTLKYLTKIRKIEKKCIHFRIINKSLITIKNN